MKTTATATTRSKSSPRRSLKRPAHLDKIPCFLATTTTTCKGMLSFLARLSGRRRRWRHVRADRCSPTSGGGGGGGGNSRPGAAAAGTVCSPTAAAAAAAAAFSRQTQVLASSSMAETDESASSCARCRAHSSCSCELLGLNSNVQQQQHSGEHADAHCRQSRYSAPRHNGSSFDQDSYTCAHKATATTTTSSSNVLLLRRRPPETSDGSSGGYSTNTTSSRINHCTWRTSYLAATLLILSTGLISYTEACSSRSTPKPRPPTPTPRPNITFHMYTCPPDYAEWYCLNGATCFTVKIVDSLLYNCLCANGYIGQRCEFKDLDGSYLPSRQRIMLETASIAGAVTIAVFLAVITFISVYIHCKRKQKELRMMSNGNGVDVVDGLPRDPELRPFCSRSRSLMIFMAKNPNSSTTTPIEHTRMPNWNYQPSCPAEASTRMANVNESKRPSQ